MIEQMTPAQLVDAYHKAHVAAEKATAAKEELAAKLKQHGACDITGTSGIIASITTRAGSSKTDWKSVCAMAEVPQALIDRFTTKGAPTLTLTLKVPQ